MTKAKTKGDKKRSKRGRPAIEGVEREPAGRISRNPSETRERREAIMRPVIEARAKSLGMDIPVLKRLPGETMDEFAARQKARDEMIRAATPALLRPWVGSSVGPAISDEADVTDLWDAVVLIRGLRSAYLHAIGAQSEHPRGANMPVAPSDESTEPEVSRARAAPLSDEEIARNAEDRWFKLRDTLLDLGPKIEIGQMAVRFTIDWICAEMPSANEGKAPKSPVLQILRHVHKRLIVAEEKS